jgi:hypothetical protein
MKRRSFDEDMPLPPHGHMQADDRLPCRWCEAPTKLETLSLYGARCFDCFQRYCRDGQLPAVVANRHTEGSKAWAYALKAREEAGERLSSAQRGMWRTALRYGVTAGDAA